MDMKQVGRFIRTRREALGLTQKALAERVHVTHSAVSKWERGLSLPDTAILPPLAQTLGVSEGELLQGRERHSPARWLKSIRALSPPKALLLRALPLWLGGLLLTEPVELLLFRQYAAQYGSESSMLSSLNSYGAAALACRALPSLLAGLWLGREAHRRQPFPVLGKHPVSVWLRHCLPGLAAAFALWFAVFVLGFWEFTDLGRDISSLVLEMCVWEPRASGGRAVAQSWRNLPWFILSDLLLGEYCFQAAAACFFYSLGVCRYCAQRAEEEASCYRQETLK